MEYYISESLNFTFFLGRKIDLMLRKIGNFDFFGDLLSILAKLGNAFVVSEKCDEKRSFANCKLDGTGLVSACVDLIDSFASICVSASFEVRLAVSCKGELLEGALLTPRVLPTHVDWRPLKLVL